MKRVIHPKRLRQKLLKVLLGASLFSLVGYELFQVFQVESQKEQKLYNALVEQADIVNSVRDLDANLTASLIQPIPTKPFSTAQIALVRHSAYIGGSLNEALNTGGEAMALQNSASNFQNDPILPPFGISYAKARAPRGLSMKPFKFPGFSVKQTKSKFW